MRYRRANTPGATYFFTLNAADRSGQLLTDHIDALRDSFRAVRSSRPFVLDAICVFPDHLHLLMTLPREDVDFATRVMLIKQASRVGFLKASASAQAVPQRANEGSGSGATGNTSSAMTPT
jgi:putative transposase